MKENKPFCGLLMSWNVFSLRVCALLGPKLANSVQLENILKSVPFMAQVWLILFSLRIYREKCPLHGSSLANSVEHTDNMENLFDTIEHPDNMENVFCNRWYKIYHQYSF